MPKFLFLLCLRANFPPMSPHLSVLPPQSLHEYIYTSENVGFDQNMFDQRNHHVNKASTKEEGFSRGQQKEMMNWTFKKAVAYRGGLRTKKATARAETGPPSQCLHSATPLGAQGPDPIHTTLLCI